jgi:hypothetical protein
VPRARHVTRPARHVPRDPQETRPPAQGLGRLAPEELRPAWRGTSRGPPRAHAGSSPAGGSRRSWGLGRRCACCASVARRRARVSSFARRRVSHRPGLPAPGCSSTDSKKSLPVGQRRELDENPGRLLKPPCSEWNRRQCRQRRGVTASPRDASSLQFAYGATRPLVRAVSPAPALRRIRRLGWSAQQKAPPP